MTRCLFWAAWVILAILTVSGGCSRKSGDGRGSKPVVTMITDEGGLGDGGFNDITWKGVETAAADLGFEARIAENRLPSEYVHSIDIAARKSAAVVTVGFFLSEPLAKVAPHHRSTQFIQIEGDVKGENVLTVDFRSEEAGYLAGVVAGMATKKGKVGIVAGRMVPAVVAYISGFKAGAAAAADRFDKKVVVRPVVVGSFDDPARGRSLAESLIAGGTDVIFRAAGKSGLGVMEAVREPASGGDVYLIGEDIDIDGEIPGRVLCSTLKRTDQAVEKALAEFMARGLQSGHMYLGYAEGGVGISPMKYTRKLFTKDELAYLDGTKKALAEAAFTVPATEEQLAGFKPPKIP